jgi:hypothetical protein
MFIAIAITTIILILIIIIVRPTPAQSGDAAGVSKNVETRQILPDAALIRLLHVPLSHVDFVHAAGPSPTYRHFCDTTGGRVRICRDWRATWTSSPRGLFDFSDVTRTRTWTLLLYYGKYYYYYYCATNKRIIMGAHQPPARGQECGLGHHLQLGGRKGPRTQHSKAPRQGLRRRRDNSTELEGRA